jgi:hypothetical protein
MPINSADVGDLAAPKVTGYVTVEQVETIALRVTAKAANAFPAVASEVAAREIATADKNRQNKEDARSIKRNRNRMYTLVFALFCSIIVTYLLSTMLKGTYIGSTFGPYSFAITILFDSGLTFWAYWHRY